MNNKLITNIIRVGFLCWVIFEFLNWIEVLHFTLDFTWLGLIITSTVVFGSVEWISYKVKKLTGSPLPWFIYLGAFFSISLDAMGDIAHWYTQFTWYDQVGHASGGGMVALLVFFVYWRLINVNKIVISKKMAGFISVAVAISLGVLYELEEYIEDLINKSNRLGTGVDTANDMLFNTMGAIIIIVIVTSLIREKTASKNV